MVLSVCPRCGAKVPAASKLWSVIPKNGYEADEPQVFIGAFQCPACQTSFNVKIPVESNSNQTVNVKNKVERIIRIQGALMQTIKTLKERIAALEAEKSNLMGEIETLRKSAEARVVTLEAEVGHMREEAKSLRELIGKSEPAVLISPQNSSAPN